MARLVVLCVVGFILYKLVANEIRKRNEKADAAKAAEMARKASVGEMVKDPVCGVYVPVSSSVSVRDGDTVHRFCGYECRDAFLQKLKTEGRVVPEKEDTKE